MEEYRLSRLQRKNFSKAVNEIYLITDYNHEQYQNYYRWFYSKSVPRVLDGSGEMLFYLDGLIVAGLAILKNTPDEKKICTLMIAEEYRKKGYGSKIVEDAFEILGTDKPLITIPERRLDEFSQIILENGWVEEERTDDYLSTEVIFNKPRVLKK